MDLMRGVPNNFRTILGEDDKFYAVTKALILRFNFTPEQVMDMPAMAVQELYSIICEESKEMRKAYG